MQEKSRPIPYPVRLPEELRGQLEDAARASARSLHAEIIERLRRSFDGTVGDKIGSAALAAAHGQLQTADALIRSLSEGFVALYDAVGHSGDEQLRRMYVTCRARLSNDPEEIEALGADDKDDQALKDFLTGIASRVRSRNQDAERRHQLMRDAIAARAKRIESVTRAEEVALKLASNLLLNEAKLPGEFDDYPPKAWMDATGFDFDTVLQVAREVGPEAEAVRVALKRRNA